MMCIMAEPSARLLRLLSFLQTPRDWSGQELAERLDVDIRTVRRDIEKLRNLGYPVQAIPGVAGYRLGAGAKMPPLLLDDDEAIAVALGLCLSAGGGIVTGAEESALRALVKIEQVLPSRLRHRFATLRSATMAVPPGTTAPDSSLLSAIALAISERRQLRFDYQAHDGAASRRNAEPYKLVNVGRRWYLLGWDVDRRDWRTYRVDRLQLRIPDGPTFTPRETPEDWIADYVSRGVSTAPYTCQSRINLQVPIAEAAQRIPPTVGHLEAVNARECLLYLGANSYDDLAIHLGLLGIPFTVQDPPELVAHLRALADRISAALS